MPYITTPLLDDTDSLVLWAAQHRAVEPLHVLAKLTGLSQRTVGYRLQRLRARGLIQPMAVINPGVIGLASYKLYFSIALTTESQRQRMLHDIVAFEQVTFLHELGGEYEYEMILCVCEIGQVAAFLEQLGGRYGAAISKKTLLVQGSYTGFGKKYLTGKAMPALKLPSAVKGQSAEIDAKDHQVLQTLSAGLWSAVQISERLNLPRSTVTLRLKKLALNGLIAGYIYSVSARSFGIQTYRLLLSARSLAPKFHLQLQQFCERHPQIVNLVATFGAWDYELAVDVSDQRALPGISRALLHTFPSEIEILSVVPLFETLKVQNYPFQKIPI